MNVEERDYWRRGWNSTREANRRAFIREVMTVFSGSWKGMLERKIRSLFQPENADKITMRTDTSLNLLSWVSNELGAIYSEAPDRTLNGYPLEESFPELHAGGKFDLALDRAARICIAAREVLIRPLYSETTGRFFLDLVTPDRVCAGHDPNAVGGLAWLLVETDPTAVSGDREKFVLWTPEEFVRLNAYGKKIEQPQPNPYGLIPYVLCHAAFPYAGAFHDSEARGIFDAAITAAIAKTEFNHLRHIQSYKQTYISAGGGSEKKARIVSDPSVVLWLEGGATAGVLDLQADLKSHLEAILADVAATLAFHGFRPEQIKGELDASSGYALTIKLLGMERIWKAQRTLWGGYEKDIVTVASRVAEIDEGRIVPDGATLETHYKPLTPPPSESERYDLISKRLQDRTLSREEAIRRMEGDERAEEILAQIAAEDATEARNLGGALL